MNHPKGLLTISVCPYTFSLTCYIYLPTIMTYDFCRNKFSKKRLASSTGSTFPDDHLFPLSVSYATVLNTAFRHMLARQPWHFIVTRQTLLIPLSGSLVLS